MYLQKTLRLFLLLPFFISCDSSTEPETPTPYMSLHIGDIRQYYSEADSSYTKWTIIGETHRSDGQKVFIGVYGEGTIDDTTSNSFYFIRNGYFYATELDTISDEEIKETNPFHEQKLAKLFPKDGDKWIHTEGTTDSTYFVSKYVGEKSTPAKKFKNVFTFILNNFLTIYYAEGFGHIGASLTNEDNETLVIYLKINGKEYGEYVPQNQIPKRNIVQNKANKPKYGFFGERLR